VKCNATLTVTINSRKASSLINSMNCVANSDYNPFANGPQNNKAQFKPPLAGFALLKSRLMQYA
jgi:hypothetical protein